MITIAIVILERAITKYTKINTAKKQLLMNVHYKTDTKMKQKVKSDNFCYLCIVEINQKQAKFACIEHFFYILKEANLNFFFMKFDYMWLQSFYLSLS